MPSFRDYEYFKEEIELALIQNSCVEIELYSIIASILRQSENKCKLSVRDVSSRRKTDISKRYCGDKGFPDLIVLAREKDSNAEIYGCIEAKMPTVQLIKDEQLNAHIKKFSKVIYTNGIRWIYFEEKDICFDITLGVMQGNKIFWKSHDNWDNLLNEIDNIEWYEIDNIFK